MLRIRQTRCADREDEIKGAQNKRIRLTGKQSIHCHVHTTVFGQIYRTIY